MENEIGITNTAVAVEKAETLLEASTRITTLTENIETILAELGEYWSATQEDQQVFYVNLKKNVENLTEIVACNQEFSEAIVEYVHALETTSQAVA